MNRQVLESLKALVGSDRVLVTEEIRKEYAQDKWPRWLISPPKQLPDCVIKPRLSEISGILALAERENVSIVPYGGGSGVCGAVTPEKGGITLDLKGCDRIDRPQVDTLNSRYFVWAEAGVIGEVLENYLNDLGFTLGHFPASLGISTVGGWIAAGSSGQYSTKYGNIEQMIDGLDVIVPGGQWKTFTGKEILPFVGSEGTLGVIVMARLKIFPLEKARQSFSFSFSSLDSAMKFCFAVGNLPKKPIVVRLYDPLDRLLLGPGRGKEVHLGRAKLWALKHPRLINACSRLLHRLPFLDLRPLALVMFEGYGNDAELEETKNLAKQYGGKNLGSQLATTWWQERFKLNYEKVLKCFSDGCFVDTLDVAGPIQSLPDLYRAMTEAMSPYAVISAHFSHFFDGRGCIYFTLIGRGRDAKDSLCRYEKAWQVGLDACVRAGGEITHHHGIGVAKRDWFKMPDDGRWNEWRRLKKLLDPKGIMNPGKLFASHT